eukprot:gene13371-13486_t
MKVSFMSIQIASRFLPWLDRQGKMSLLKALTLAVMLAPGLWIATQLGLGWLQPKPITLAIHGTGDWAIRFLVLSLMITPMRRIADWPKLIVVRRMIGVTAFAYTLIHFTLYIIDQQWNLLAVAQEIALRFYLTIGFLALLGLAVLAATSTDKMIKRLGGPRWNKLHKIVYALAAIGLLHYLIQSKLDISRAVLIVGFYIVFMLHRVMQKRGIATNFISLVGLGVVSACVTALLESLWYHFRNGADILTILANNFNFLDGFHISEDFELTDLTVEWWIIGFGLALGLVNLWQRKMLGAKLMAFSKTRFSAT